MMTTIIGRIDTENKTIGLYKNKVTRRAALDDIVLSDTGFHRLVWNHNGQRLTSRNITELVMEAWERSEADSDLLAAQIDADRKQLLPVKVSGLKPRFLVQRRQQWAVQ